MTKRSPSRSTAIGNAVCVARVYAAAAHTRLGGDVHALRQRRGVAHSAGITATSPSRAHLPRGRRRSAEFPNAATNSSRAFRRRDPLARAAAARAANRGRANDSARYAAVCGLCALPRVPNGAMPWWKGCSVSAQIVCREPVELPFDEAAPPLTIRLPLACTPHWPIRQNSAGPVPEEFAAEV